MANKAKTKENKVTIQSKEVAKEEKVKIYEFDPVIYPFRLWVAVRPNVEPIAEKFYNLDTSMNLLPVTPEYFYKNRFSVATTYPMEDKKSGYLGCLISIWRPKDLSSSKIAHESSHVTDYLCDVLGVNGFTLDGGEARAYFIEWVVDCIEKVKQGKV